MAAITSAAIGAGTALFSARQGRRQQRQQQQLAQQGIESADPFREHRGAAAERLNRLMADPSSITETPAYRARMQAVQRQLAAQGFTGSGNALVEAAEASGAVFQQEFENLGRLSGAFTTPGGGFDNALQSGLVGNAQNLSNLAGVGNNLTNLALVAGHSGRFNRPAVPVRPIQRSPMPVQIPRVNVPTPTLPRVPMPIPPRG